MNTDRKIEAGRGRAYSSGALRGGMEGFLRIVEPKSPQN